MRAHHPRLPRRAGTNLGQRRLGRGTRAPATPSSRPRSPPRTTAQPRLNTAAPSPPDAPTPLPLTLHATHEAALAAAAAAGGGSIARGVLASLPRPADPTAPDTSKLLTLSEAYWGALKSSRPPRPPRAVAVRLPPGETACGVDGPTFDVAILGGTLGLLLASSLAATGLRVALVERRSLAGRAQEWNAAKDDLHALVDAGAITPPDLSAATVTHCGPLRVAFHETGPGLALEGALDVGVSPERLLAAAATRFRGAGGVAFERATFAGATIGDDGVRIEVTPSARGGADVGDANRPNAVAGDDALSPSPPPPTLTARLVVDAMGHWSPLAAQMRGPGKPASVCIMVGACYDVCGGGEEGKKEGDASTAADSASIPSPRLDGDFLTSVRHATPDGVQWFWETFPAAGGAARTAYMFCYADTLPDRPSLTSALDTFFTDLPLATGHGLHAICPRRVLFGAFPAHTKKAPLKPTHDRVLHVGDAGAFSSPLSFGGFGAFLRHLPRLTAGISACVREGAVCARSLAALAPYSPGLGAARLFASAMRVGGAGSVPPPPPDHTNRLLAANFRVLAVLGAWALSPFVGERLHPVPLAATMGGMALAAPLTVARVVRRLGLGAVLTWTGHAVALAAYWAAALLLRPFRRLLTRTRRGGALLAALEHGAGLDGWGGGRVRVVGVAPAT